MVSKRKVKNKSNIKKTSIKWKKRTKKKNKFIKSKKKYNRFIKNKNMKGGGFNSDFLIETEDKYYYEDKGNNINIEIDKSSPLNINIFTAQSDKKKDRAPKGMTRKVLCELLIHISGDKSRGKEIILSISGHDIQGITSDNSKLKKMYENMGFESISERDMKITIDRFIKECEYNIKKDATTKSNRIEAHEQEQKNFLLRKSLGLPPLSKYLPPPPS